MLTRFSMYCVRTLRFKVLLRPIRIPDVLPLTS
jgi:hypothetical protein